MPTQETPFVVSDYIEKFPRDVQRRLRAMANAIKKAAPGARPLISYGMPTYRQVRNLVHFAGYKNHTGFYPGTQAIRVFKKELSPYKHAKGSVQFRHDEPLPFALVTRIVKFRVKQELARAKEKKIK